MRQKDPLRSLTNSELRALEQLARSHSAPALSVDRARALLAVSGGATYTEAARLVGRSVGDSIAQWVARFNQVGLAAVERQAGDGQHHDVRYATVHGCLLPIPRAAVTRARRSVGVVTADAAADVADVLPEHRGSNAGFTAYDASE